METNNKLSQLWNSLAENKLFWEGGSILVVAVICALIFYFNITLNFTILGLLIILTWLLVFQGFSTFQKRSRKPRTNGVFVTGKENAEFAMISCVALLIIGILAMHTLDNYFYPKEQVYRNIDHHVVQLEGAQILNPQDYVLAENTSSAFWDSKTMNGKISISNYTDTSAISLHLDRCTRALYSSSYYNKRCVKRDLLNKEQLLHFNDGKNGDTLFLRLSDGQELKFFTTICQDNGFLKTPHHVPFSKRNLIFKHRKDSAIYGIQLGDSTYYSEEHRILTTGLALNDLLKGVSLPDIDLSGINIIRPVIYPTELNDLKVFVYDTIGYNVEYVRGGDAGALTTVTHIRSHSDNTWRSLKTNHSQTVKVPYGTSISLGFPMNSRQHIYFTKDSAENVYVHYRQPKRAYLPGEIKDKKFNSVYVATSLVGDAEKLQFVPEQIILFDEFEKFDNGNNMTPFTLSYIAGPTTQNLELIAKTESSLDTLLMGNNPLLPIKGIQSQNRKLHWEVRVENLKETTNCKIRTIKRNIILLSIAFALLILFGAVRFYSDSEEKEKRNTFTFAEFVLYSIILYLLTFRWFLLWRVSVFVPTEDVSYYEYETLFRGVQNMHTLNTMITAFVIIVLGIKLMLITNLKEILLRAWTFLYERLRIRIIVEYLILVWNRFVGWLRHSVLVSGFANFRIKFSTQRKRIEHVCAQKLPFEFKQCIKHFYRFIARIFKFTYLSIPSICVVMFILVLPISFVFRTSPAISISITVLSYILSVAICNEKLLAHYKLEDQQCDNLSSNHPIAKYLWAVILNTLLYAGILFVLDSGYAILFLTFSVFYLIWLLHEYVTCYMSDEAYNRGRDWCVFVLFIGFICLLCYYREMFNFILNSNILVIGLVFTLIACAVLALACYAILNIKIAKKSILLLSLCAILMGGVGMGFKYFLPRYAAHTTERITVHFADPEDVLGSKESEKDMQKYMEAAINHMIIGEYEERGHSVKVFGEGSLGYFKMQPHSKIGAMWNAQLTDISLVRYCIAEHGRWLPICFMLAFIILLFASIRMPLYHRWARTILILVPLLFTVQSLLIWMANTQRFIFLGQDFPLVSINSRLTLIFFVGLSLLWIATLLYEKVHFFKVYEDNDDAYDLRLDNDWRYEVARRDSLKVGVIMLVALCFCAGIHHLRTKPEKSFEVKSLMESVQDEIDKTINPLLKEYQRQNGCISLQRRNIHNEIVAFNIAMNVEEYIKQNVTDASCVHLVETLWKTFVEKGSKNNSSSLVMHARLVREQSNLKYAQIKVIQKYYDKQLPKRDEQFWRGSFVTRSYSENKLISAQYGSATTYTIPQEWLETSYSIMIVNNHKGKYGSSIVQGNNVAYLARNVRVNGKPMFIYPLEEKFYWIRNFAEQIATQKNKLKDEDRDDKFNDNVEMTISTSLTENLYTCLKQSLIEQPSVIVANGDGDVLAMVSYDKEYHLNPNDHRSILFLYDSLYINGLNGTQLELRAFANRNLIYLPGGPGSSQKPLLWTAIASAIDFPWKELAIAPYYGKIEKISKNKKDYYRIEKFNDHKLRGKGWDVLTTDENGGNGVDLEGFMAHSSNVYNALMAYIGSFAETDDVINNIGEIGIEKDGSHMFAFTSPLSRMSKEEYRSQFPMMYYRNNTRKVFAFDAFPNYETQENSILERQMYRMFLNDKYRTKDKIMQSSTAVDALSLTDIVNNFAYCAQSSLQERGKNIFNYMEKGIRSTAIGSQSVWDITPWKMAESYGRMASLNKNYTLSVVKKPRDSYERFDLLQEGYKQARGMQMRGMGKVFTEPYGTAHAVGNGLQLPMVNRKKVNRIGNYYLYAKTGTTDNGVSGRGYKEFHRLGVIIADKDLSTVPIGELNEVKYCVVYFAVRNNREKWNLYTKCIKKIIESKEFNNYMNQE